MTTYPADWDATFWDIGGVIVDHDSIGRLHHAFVESVIESLSLDVPAQDATETWQTTVGGYFRERTGTEFRLADEAYHHGVEAVVGEPVERATWRPLFDRAFAEHVEPKPEAVSTLRSLAQRDVHVGIVSDIDDREADAVLELFGLEDAFDSVTTSERVGRTKPDGKMFEVALRRASASPDRSLMVGDRYRHDIEGAAESGLWTVAYGAETGPAVDFRVEDLSEVVAIVDGDYGPVRTE
jgi:putative hydrolase of the HAD superfamily